MDHSADLPTETDADNRVAITVPMQMLASIF